MITITIVLLSILKLASFSRKHFFLNKSYQYQRCHWFD